MNSIPEYAAIKLDERLIREEVEKQVVQARIRGDRAPSRTSRMVTICGGVMQRWRDSDHFEAAVETEEGPEFLKGRLGGQKATVDVQSGPLRRWSSAIYEASEAIRFAYEKQKPREALGVIGQIWEELDRTSELAAARSHLLLGKMSKPILGEIPDWLEDQKAGLFTTEQGELPASPLAVETAVLLLRAVIASVPGADDLAAEVEVGPLGRVVIDWDIPETRLQWMVEAIDLPWPSVKVYQLLRQKDPAGPSPPETRIFHSAVDIVESFAAFLQGR